MRNDSTCQETRTIQLADYTTHMNNNFGYHNVGVIMGMSVVPYSQSYGANLVWTSSTHDPPVDKETAVALSVSHNALHYSSEQKNYRTTNVSTFK